MHYDGGEAHALTNQIAEVLARVQNPTVFERGGRLVYVSHGYGRAKTAQFGKPQHRISTKRIAEWGSAELATRISKYVSLTENGPNREDVGATAKGVVTQALAACQYDSVRLPALVGFAEVPVMRGAEIVSPVRRTYDADLEIEVDPCRADLSDITRTVGNPNHDDAKAAYARVAHRMRNFPWVAPHHFAAWFAHAASHFLQFDGVTAPIFAYNAPKAGTGKSVAMLIATMVGTGYAPRKASLSSRRTEDEFAKRLVAFAKASDRAVCFDNHKGEFSSSTVESTGTDQLVSERNLGNNTSFDGALLTVISVTGNNLDIGREMLRRVVPIELDAHMDHPEERPASEFDGMSSPCPVPEA